MVRKLVALFALLATLYLPGVRAFARSGDALRALEKAEESIKATVPTEADQSNAALKADGYATYVNGRYGYEIAYPRDIFTPQGESDAGDGQRFLGADGATLTVYGGYNALNTPLAEEYAEAQKSMVGGASYKVMNKTWFVVSGLEGADIRYRKTMDAGDRRFTFELVYPAAEKEQYDPIIPRILKSFQAFSPALPGAFRSKPPR